VSDEQPRRGRPLDPAVGDAVLRATLDLLEQHGYDGLRVEDIAARAGAGLGAVYRRWHSKRELVITAVRSQLDNEPPREPRHPEAALVSPLVDLAKATAGPGGTLMLDLLADTRADGLADAVREAKVEPVLDLIRERLRRLIGDAADLELKAHLGPALIVFRGLVLRSAMTRAEIVSQVLPLMTGDACEREVRWASAGERFARPSSARGSAS
jgi:AcrR family transcriptional regulator